MTREKAIAEMRDWAVNAQKNIARLESEQNRFRTAKLTAHYSGFVEVLEYAAGTMEKTSWISVSERLPDDDRMVLVWTVTKKGIGYVNRAYCVHGYWHGSGSMAGVTHWMELPEGPESERMTSEEEDK